MSKIPNDIKLKELESRIGADAMAQILAEVETVSKEADGLGVTFKETTATGTETTTTTKTEGGVSLAGMQSQLAALMAQVATLQSAIEGQGEVEAPGGEGEMMTETETKMDAPEDDDEEEAGYKEMGIDPEVDLFGDMTVKQALGLVAILNETMEEQRQQAQTTKEQGMVTTLKEAVKEALAPLAAKIEAVEANVARLMGEQPKGQTQGYRASIAQETTVKEGDKLFQVADTGQGNGKADEFNSFFHGQDGLFSKANGIVPQG